MTEANGLASSIALLRREKEKKSLWTGSIWAAVKFLFLKKLLGALRNAAVIYLDLEPSSSLELASIAQ